MEQILDYSEIGQWLKRERRKQKLTQLDVAAYSGYSGAYISRIEKGIDLPRLQVTEDLLNALGYRLILGVEKYECD